MTDHIQNHVTAFKCAKYIDKVQLRSFAQLHEIHLERFLDSFYFEIDGNQVITFYNGVIVQWGSTELHPMVRDLAKACTLQPLDTMIEQAFTFRSNQPKFSIDEDIINISKIEPLTLVSISHALARSVQLEYNERAIDSVLTSIQKIPTDMKLYGTIRMKRKKIRKLIGLVMDTQHTMSVFGLVEDHPELFWEQPAMISLYKETAQYVELRERWGVLSEKIQYLDSTFSLLRDEMHVRKSHLLEWIIIVLILWEIIVAVDWVALFAQ